MPSVKRHKRKLKSGKTISVKSHKRRKPINPLDINRALERGLANINVTLRKVEKKAPSKRDLEDNEVIRVLKNRKKAIATDLRLRKAGKKPLSDKKFWELWHN